jgi:hypothetical protein
MDEVGVEVAVPAAGEVEADGDAFDFREAEGGDIAVVGQAEVVVVGDGGVDSEGFGDGRGGEGRGVVFMGDGDWGISDWKFPISDF